VAGEKIVNFGLARHMPLRGEVHSFFSLEQEGSALSMNSRRSDQTSWRQEQNPQDLVLISGFAMSGGTNPMTGQSFSALGGFEPDPFRSFTNPESGAPISFRCPEGMFECCCGASQGR